MFVPIVVFNSISVKNSGKLCVKLEPCCVCCVSEMEYFKVNGNHFCRFSDSLLPSAVVDLLCEEAVHEQESLRPWAVKQSGHNFKHFHSKMFKSFAFVLDTFFVPRKN